MGERAPEEVATASSTNPVSIEDAISALGVGEGTLSASIMHEIQQAVNVNAEEAERRVMEKAAAEAAAEAAAQKEAEEKAAAEAAGQKEAEEKAAAEAAEQAAKDAESQERAALLLQMGFSEEQVQGALEATQGSLERAADWLFVNVPQTEPEEVVPVVQPVVEPVVQDVVEAAFPEEWEQLAADLEEMGFNAMRAKEQLVKAEGNFKLAIKALVEAERGAM